MAKIRVYELARELNMESKELVEKLKAGGLDIINFSSTLDENKYQKAMNIIKGGPTTQVIEEERVKPGVIRRRKKVVAVEPEADKAEEAVELPGKIITEAESQAAEFAQKVHVSAKEKYVPEEELEQKKERHDKKDLVSKVPSAPEEAPVVEEEAVSEKTPAGMGGVQAQVEAPASADESISAHKKARKKQKDRPARIISMPEHGPLKAVIAGKKEERPPLKVQEAKGQAVPVGVVPEEEGEKRPLKKRKERKKGDKDRKEPDADIRIRHKKLEIFERADLYEDRKPRVKDKKQQKGGEIKRLKHTEITTPKAIKRRIKIQENVTVVELAKAMGVKAVELVKKLVALGVMANLNNIIDFDTAVLAADEFGYELELDQFDIKNIIEEVKDRPENLKPRPPVVTIMGHVDHGKTSLLDRIRSSNIADGESGGITQHIGAYYVNAPGGDIVFLDTPGHEAFTAMRARGAKVTDIIVLVVAADDGVMPQTREAIDHARAANIPIIVAINKIDKPEANPDKVIRELAELDLAPEEWGGTTIFGRISAKTGEGIDSLMELILLQAEMLELKANPDKPARGTIIEAKLDKNKGSVATVLIKEGTLKQSDFFICGGNYGKIRAMNNHRGTRMISAGPSMPVEIYGISGVPLAGDEFIVVKDERVARQIVDYRQIKQKEKERARNIIVNLEGLYEKIKEGKIKELNIILKTDVQGSLEALSEALLKLGTDEVKIKMIHSSTGAIKESDVMLASASGAVIIAFRVRANPRVKEIAERENVDINYYDVIYNLIDDIRKAMAGLLEPISRENVIGRVDIRETFNVPKIGTVAGCYVTDGRVERNAMVRLLRDDVVVFDGKMASLRRFKGDVKEVAAGYECGIGLESFQDIKPGDVFEVYKIEQIKAEL
ncbi:MAG: translation initiation factor IF-2 [Deltaproteobacteria bacterium]|nr:translation initiation factor IF-2 [Deltaproteobacteria bacterium]